MTSAAADAHRSSKKRRHVKAHIDILHSCVSSSKADRAAALRAARALRELALQEENTGLLVEEGAAGALVKHLQSPITDDVNGSIPYEHEVEEEAAFAIGLLAVKPEHQRLLNEADTIIPLVDLLRMKARGTIPGMTICRVVDAISNLARDNEIIQTELRIEGVVAFFRFLLESSDRMVRRSAVAALQNIAPNYRIENPHLLERPRYRRRTRGEEKKFQEDCVVEAIKNKDIERVLQIFSEECCDIYIHIPGASAHASYLLQRLYNGCKYEVRLYQNLKDMSVTMVFGQAILAIINTETLAEACKRAGTVLNEAISSHLESDRLYALPNKDLHVYAWDDLEGYRVYEALVRVDFQSPTELDIKELKDITRELTAHNKVYGTL